MGDVDVSEMDSLASARHFPWAPDGAAAGRARFPCEVWQQDHAVLAGAGASRGEVLCELDVVEQPLGEAAFGAARLLLPPGCGGAHALATWSEVASADGASL